MGPRFADDILLFARSAQEAATMLDALVQELSHVGLILNASKTVALTTEAQALTALKLFDGSSVSVLPRETSHKWLGCMLAASSPGVHLWITIIIDRRRTKLSMFTRRSS